MGRRSAFATDSFQEANRLYQEGKYAQAAQAYEDTVKSNPAPEVYYNLGNAYFKDQKLGLAILNYERALQLSPRDSDTLANLSYAGRLIDYRIEDKRNWYARKLNGLLRSFTLAECWLAALGAYLIFILGLFISLLSRRHLIFGTSGALAFGVFLFCLLPALLKYGELKKGRTAIVTEPQAEVRFGPLPSDRLAFRLVEGLKVSIRDEHSDWYRIELADGQSGWVKRAQVTTV
jgi:tetratricopeptide (TPR) repeat protein